MRGVIKQSFRRLTIFIRMHMHRPFDGPAPCAFGRSSEILFMPFDGSSTRLGVCITHRVCSAVQHSAVSISTRQIGSILSASSVGMATQGHRHQVVRALPRVGEALSFSYSCATLFCSSSGRFLLQRNPLSPGGQMNDILPTTYPGDRALYLG